MSPRTAVVDRYFDGFRPNHAQILECLTDDVVWNLPGSNLWRARTPSTAKSRTNDLSAHRPSMSIG
jgi:ketosteroid isomerase-like protein